MEQLTKKYPKSISGKQCVDLCYKKNTKIMHPIYFNLVTNKNDSFCPVANFFEKQNEKIIKNNIDVCNENIQKSNLIFNEIDMLYPYIDFNSMMFLNMCYNINNFSDGLTWIVNNSHLLIDTRERIFNLLLDAYENKIDIIEISDTRISDFIHILIRSKYIYTFENLFKFIHIDDKTVSIDDKSIKIKESNLYKKESNESIVIKTNYILKNIIITSNITNFLSTYFKNKIETSIKFSQSEQIIDKFIIYLIDNIKKLFSK